MGWFATNPELAALDFRIESGGLDSLSGEERRQLVFAIQGTMREWENSYYQYEQGLFDQGEFEARRERWRINMARAARSSAYQQLWNTWRDTFAPSFRAEIDRIVAEVGG